ncbi:MAG: hypothetical protein ABIS17_04860 [Casimicrobiaceae bacterium]
MPTTAASLLARAKEATGGKAWDHFGSQHSLVKLEAGTRAGTAERWASLLTGRSRMRLEVDGTIALIGFDGFVAWSQQGGRVAAVEVDPITARLAANGAYRDRLAFWFPERQAAKTELAGSRTADGNAYTVVAITPEGGERYEAWVNDATHRIERLREPEYNGSRTEIYGDFREVQGVQVPFEVRVVRDDPVFNERYKVERLEYNVPLDGIDFAVPGTAR